MFQCLNWYKQVAQLEQVFVGLSEGVGSTRCLHSETGARYCICHTKRATNLSVDRVIISHFSVLVFRFPLDPTLLAAARSDGSLVINVVQITSCPLLPAHLV